MTIDPLLQLVLASALALLFLGAALHKQRAPVRFRAQLAAYDVVPGGFVPGISALLPWIEIATALLLLPVASRAAGATLTIALLGVYALAMAANLLRGRRAIDCGCGDKAQPLSWALVLRNLVLALGASLLLPAPLGRTLTAGDAVLACALIALLALAHATVNQLLSNAAALRGEVPHES